MKKFLSVMLTVCFMVSAISINVLAVDQAPSTCPIISNEKMDQMDDATKAELEERAQYMQDMHDKFIADMEAAKMKFLEDMKAAQTSTDKKKQEMKQKLDDYKAKIADIKKARLDELKAKLEELKKLPTPKPIEIPTVEVPVEQPKCTLKPWPSNVPRPTFVKPTPRPTSFRPTSTRPTTTPAPLSDAQREAIKKAIEDANKLMIDIRTKTAAAIKAEYEKARTEASATTTATKDAITKAVDAAKAKIDEIKTSEITDAAKQAEIKKILDALKATIDQLKSAEAEKIKPITDALKAKVEELKKAEKEQLDKIQADLKAALEAIINPPVATPVPAA